MGYQVAVTPLQMVAAVSSVANGGEYVEPRVVRAIYRNGVRYQTPPKIAGRTISANTAAVLTQIMEGVVTNGTAKLAAIDGFTIAGKTGTAQKLISGRYSSSDHYASFVGFLPSRDPQLAIIVVLDSPHGPNGDHGGRVAAPIFKSIAAPALRYLGIAPTINPAAPVLVARRNAPETGPVAGIASTDATMKLIVDEPEGIVPDLRGLSARDAVRKLVRLGMTARLSGDGFVVSQDPLPGTPLESEGVCTIVLERTPPKRTVAADEGHQ
jgi:cell division protein FtsI (penicillin-binding protein 3)